MRNIPPRVDTTPKTKNGRRMNEAMYNSLVAMDKSEHDKKAREIERKKMAEKFEETKKKVRENWWMKV